MGPGVQRGPCRLERPIVHAQLVGLGLDPVEAAECVHQGLVAPGGDIIKQGSD